MSYWLECDFSYGETVEKDFKSVYAAATWLLNQRDVVSVTIEKQSIEEVSPKVAA